MFRILAVLQSAAIALLLVRLWPGRRRLPAVAPVTEDLRTGLVSVIVATLNEAHRITPCLHGLLAQGPLVGQILVVDSGSLDGTDRLVRAAMTTDHRVQLLRDDPLPPGWVGKVWALQHGLRYATGEWVLGVDADTAPHPGLSGGAVAAAEALHYDAVSFAPRFQMSSAAERWLQPALLTTLVYRFGAAGTMASAERVMANGQCFLARREALLSVGGYASARHSFSDDVTLARHLARSGYRVGFLDGARLYDVRSYNSVGELWREWGRSLDLKDSSSSLRTWTDVLFLIIVQGLPIPALLWILIASALVGPHAMGPAVPLMLTSSVLIAVRILFQRALRTSYERRGISFWLSPLADPLAALRILLSSLVRPRQWRGRVYLATHRRTVGP